MAIKSEDLRLNIIVNGDDGRKKILEQESAVKSLSNSLDEAVKKLEILKQAGKGETGTKAKKAAKEVEDYSKKLEAAKMHLNELKRQQDIQTMTMDELARHIRQVNLVLRQTDPGTDLWKKLNAELKESKERFKELSSQSQSTGGILKKLGSMGAGAVGMIQAAISAVNGLIRGVASVVSKMADFEQANANLSTILGVSKAEMDRLTDSALLLGQKTEYTASQVTLLQTELAKLGFTPDQILNMEEPVLHFATAVGADLPEAAALAGASLRMFGLKSSDTEDTLATLAVATNKSALNFSYLQTAMSIVGPVARTFGFSVKDTTALLGTLANAGFDASSAATATRNILLNLADANGKLAKALGGPVETFPELIDGLRTLNERGVDLATTLELTDKRSVAAFNSFLSGADSAQELRESLENVDGELERIADERLNTVQGSVKLLQSAWESFILSMRDSTGVIKKVIDFLTKSLNAVTMAIFPEAKIRARADVVSKEIVEVYKENGVDAAQEAMDTKVAEAEQRVKEAEKKVQEIEALNARNMRGPMATATIMPSVPGSGKAMRELKEAKKELEAVKAAADSTKASILSMEMESVPDITTPGNGATSTTGGSSSKSSSTSSSQKWSLENDASYLMAKRALIEKYNAGDISSQKEYEKELYDLEISTLTARIALGKETGVEMENLQIKLQEKLMQHKEDTAKIEREGAEIIASIEIDKNKKAQDSENKRYEEERKKYEEYEGDLKSRDAILEAIEKKHQANLSQIDMDRASAEMTLLEQRNKQRRADIEEEWAFRLNSEKTSGGNLLNIRKEMNSQLALADLDYLNGLKETLERLLSDDTLIMSEEQRTKYETQLKELKKQIKTAVVTANENADHGKIRDSEVLSGTGKGELFGVSQEQWGALFRNLKEGKLRAEDLENVFAAVGSAAQEGFTLASKFISMTNAKEKKEFEDYKKGQDTKKTALKKTLDAGLMTQAQHDAEIAKMETEAEAREAEMKLRQAKREKKLSVSQAIINSALGVAKTLAQWGIPAGLAPAAIMTAMGAAQVAMIASTSISGLEKGGAIDETMMQVKRKQDGKMFTARLSPEKRGFVSTPTVIVGETGSEYIIPHEAVENPSILPFIQTIETARRNGQLKSLNLAAVDPDAALAASGYAKGGYVAKSVSNYEQTSVRTSTESDNHTQELLTAINSLNKVLSSPIRAEVAMLGRGGLVEAQEKYERQSNRGKIGG